MNKYVKEFLHRGLVFGGFGPIVLGIVYYILSKTINSFTLSGGEVFLGVISTYMLAFIQAGSTVYNQIDHWSTVKSLLCHLSTLYVVYSLFYVMNTWIPFEPKVLLFFTVIFITVFFLVWGIVYFTVKATSKKFNKKIN